MLCRKRWLDGFLYRRLALVDTRKEDVSSELAAGLSGGNNSSFAAFVYAIR
jgi:hypothetical protein